MSIHPSSQNNKRLLLFTHIDERKETDILTCKSTDTVTVTNRNKIASKSFNDKITVPKIVSGLSKSKHHLFVDRKLFSDKNVLKEQQKKQQSLTLYTANKQYHSLRFVAQKQRTHHYVFGYIRAHQFTTNINLSNDIYNTIFTYCYIDGVKDLLKPIPTLSIDMKQEVFIERVNICCTVFDFTTSSKNECEAIQNKKERLSEIMDYLEMNDNLWINKQILKCIMNMITKNLFRSLPFVMTVNTPDYFHEFEEDEPFEDPQFEHLCYVYEIALMFVKNIKLNNKEQKRFIGKRFLKPLFQLLASRDYREREYVKQIMHVIYAKNVLIRKVIRKELCNCCYRVMYSDYDCIENGINECLQLLCSIIQGLSTPIKEEYILILNNILIPLHKINIRILNKFSESLLKCLIQLILKDTNIGVHILNNLLFYWPYQSSSKCDLFLKEIILIINTIMFDINLEDINNNFNNILPISIREKLISKLIECIICSNYCLCEKALQSFAEDGIQKLIDFNKQITWNKILKVLFDQKNNQRHWCNKLQNSYDLVLNLFINRDETFVKQFENIYSQMSMININEFKEGFYKHGYNPMYPDKKLLFNCKKNRIKKHKQIKIMAKKNKQKLLKQCRGNKGRKVPSNPPPKPPIPPVSMRMNNNKCKVIKKGFMLKRGKYNKSFKKRYFELLTNKKLYYYKSYYNGKAVNRRGVVNLNIVNHIEKTGENAIKIITTTRDWSFLCKSKHERDYWYIFMAKCAQS